MRSLIAGAAFLIVPALLLCGQNLPIAPDWVYISTPMHWQSPPAKLELQERTSPATILIINPTGEYDSVFCYVIEQQDKTITLSNGDGFVVRRGSWLQNGNHRIATAKVIFRTVERIGEVAEPEERLEYVVGKNGTGLQAADGHNYAHSPRFKDFAKIKSIAQTK
jgi:hypothetical protein